MIRLILIGLWSLLLCQANGQTRVVSDSLFQEQRLLLDSINIEAVNNYATTKHQYDSISQHYSLLISALQNKVDSLTKINVQEYKAVKTIDSLDQVKEKKVSIIKAKAEELKTNYVNKINQISMPPELQEKVEAYKVMIDKINISVPSSQFEVLDFQLPMDVKLLAPDLNNILGDGLSNLSELDIGGVEAINQNEPQIKELVGVIPQNINAENLAQTAEANLSKINEIDAVKDQLGDLPEIPMSSEEEARKALINQAREAAVDHFAGKETELKSVMDQITKYKKKFPDIKNLEDLEKHLKRRPNDMKGKPVIERIVPGIAFQMQKKNNELFVDFNPYAGYRFTGKLTAGLGWNQRVPFNKPYFQTAGRIYGPRTFAEYKLFKGFSPRIEVEAMNTFVPPYIRTSPNDRGGMEWVLGVFTGIKKEYSFFKKINGTALVMFRLFDPHRKSPYADVINARFGFEFPMKKKAKNSSPVNSP